MFHLNQIVSISFLHKQPATIENFVIILKNIVFVICKFVPLIKASKDVHACLLATTNSFRNHSLILIGKCLQFVVKILLWTL